MECHAAPHKRGDVDENDEVRVRTAKNANKYESLFFFFQNFSGGSLRV